MKIPSPPSWLILIMAIIALGVALASCEISTGVPADSYVVYRCPRDNYSSYTRDRSAIDVYRTTSGEQFFTYEWRPSSLIKMDPTLDPKEACV